MRAEIAERKAEILAVLRERSSANRIAAPPMTPRPNSGAAPLSFAQERLWFLEELEPKTAAYNICRASCLLGKLSPPALKASLNEIVSRHEILRTAFRFTDGRPVQIVLPTAHVSIKTVDLSSLAEAKRQKKIDHTIKAETERPFDLSAGNRLRCTLIHARKDEHVLILTTHHSVADVWSMGILTRELWTLYEASSNGKPSPLEPLPVQYSDYAVWQRQWLQGGVLESQLAYWKERLKDLSVLNFPTDRPRKPRQSFGGARLPIIFPEDLTRSVNELSHRFAVTPFMTLLAAFQVVLYRYTGQEDIVVGSPIANRRRPELEGLIGFFVNTLVLRADLSGNPSFSEFLFRVRDTCIGADANQDLPFEKLVQELQPERDQSRNPLFQVMFVLQNATGPFTGIPGLQIHPVEIAATRSPFDLSLFLRERDGKYIGYIEYSADLFDRDRIERMADHYRTLLEAIVADPDQSIATLPILTEAERHQILVEWNDTAADYPKDKCIHHLFEEQAERTPEAIALEFEGRQITYRQLNERANQLAHYLIALGIGPEKLVGICVERSIEMAVGLLGILKAGGAYVPLDPAYPKERLRFMLEDSRLSVLMTEQKLIDDREWRIEGGDSRPPSFQPGVQTVYFDHDRPKIEQQSRDNPSPNIRSQNLAYVIYTSGSTGKPKGVAIEHRNTVNLLYWAKRTYEPSELTGVFASTSICFDLSVFELFVPLSWGGKVILAENALALRDAANKGITLVNTVPSVMAALLTSEALPKPVRVVNLAGEPLRPELVEQLYRPGTIEKVYDLYGPSETTTYSTFIRRTENGRASIGRPISNTNIYLLDPKYQPVPIGVPGEIFIGGAGVARGYLNRPDLTRENFIRDPSADNPGGRLYKTGDLARYLADGNIEFLGRRDNQVKIHGYRIELDEIENVLNQHPAVKQSVLVIRDCNASTENTLTAYVVPKRQFVPQVAEFRSFLKTKLPDYMIPSNFVILHTLPLTVSGKIDRDALSKSDNPNLQNTDRFIEPQTQTQHLVAQTWREVLKIEDIGIHDNFFELGGHSLLAIQVFARLREAFDREIPLSALFSGPTIADLSRQVEVLQFQGGGSELPPIVHVRSEGRLPLSVNQEHLWHIEQVIPGTDFFNMPYVFHLSGDLQIGALEKALAELLVRHQSLRTVYSNFVGRPAQVVKEVTKFRLPIVDISTEAPNSVASRAADLVLAERTQAFDLTTGPPIRNTLLRLKETEFLLLVTVNHIACDAWSIRIFWTELAVLYGAFSEGLPCSLTQPKIQFLDYVLWERKLLAEGLLQETLTYWQNKLANPLSELVFQPRRKQQKVITGRMSSRPIEFTEKLFACVRTAARKGNCTVFIILVTALNILIHLYTGQRDIRIGTLVANRVRRETEGTIGHFVNTVVLRSTIDRQLTVQDLLAQIKNVTLEAYMHQACPFEEVARVLEKSQGTPRETIFQVLINYSTFGLNTFTKGGLTFAPIDVKPRQIDSFLMATTLDLMFNFSEATTQLTATVNYKSNIFDTSMIHEMIHTFRQLLEIIITRPDQRIETISLLHT